MPTENIQSSGETSQSWMKPVCHNQTSYSLKQGLTSPFISKGPNLISRQGQSSGSAGDKQIPFIKFAYNLQPVNLQLFSFDPKQLQSLTVKHDVHRGVVL